MELLEKHFDTAFAAHNGADNLRKSILSLAIQGKLEPQNPDDDPACYLLVEIAKAKKELVEAKKIKRTKPLPVIDLNDVPFKIPDEWEWSRLGESVSLLGDGIHGTPNYDESGEYFFINGNNLSDGVIEIKPNTKKVSTTEYLKHRKDLNESTVLVSINGTIGNVAFYNSERVILGKSACYLNLFPQLDKHYIKKLFNSSYFLQYALSSATGSTIKNVSLRAMREFLVPLPPLAEQRRIVAKIDQLMARCDELEKLREARDRTRIKVHMAACDRLLAAPDTDTFTQSWQFITQHFSELYTVKENVVELRKAILQLAVMGKLAQQDQHDVSAVALVDSIRKKIKELVTQKIEKKIKCEPIGSEDEVFTLPDNWTWTRLGSLLQSLRYGTSKKCNFNTPGTPVLRIPNIDVNQGCINADNLKYTNLSESELQGLSLSHILHHS